MIYEYALEPELVATWGNQQEYRYFIDKFGLGQPRVAARYPKRWARMVWGAFSSNNDLERTRMTELLARLSERMTHRPAAGWDPTKPWLHNAEIEHARRPFHKILAHGRDDTVENHPRGLPVARNAAAMASAVAPMLRCCRVAIFVDPYFGPENPRHRRPLEVLLEALSDGRRSDHVERIEVHTFARADAQFFRGGCEEHMPRCVPAGYRVRFVRWRERKQGEWFHHRYILTDIGGVAFLGGLDDGREGQTDDVMLMDRAQYELRWRQYASDEPAFDLAEAPIEIVGERG
jgi:hypothetical protein